MPRLIIVLISFPLAVLLNSLLLDISVRDTSPVQYISIIVTLIVGYFVIPKE